MKPTLFPSTIALAFLALLVTGPGFSPVIAQPAGPPNSKSRAFDDFNLIIQRNIFDSTRRPRSAAPPPRSRETAPAPPPTVEFTLAGALIHDSESVAFFDGSESQFRKALTADDEIAGFSILEIRSDQVVLESNGNKVELPIGMRMVRRGDEEWRLLSREEGRGSSQSASRPSGRPSSISRSPAASGGGRPSSARTATAPAEPDADADEILKRLMQQREQELNR